MKNRIIFIVILLWFLLAIVRLITNFANMIYQDSRFFAMNDSEKREELLPCFPIAEYFKKEKAQRILYIGRDGFCFFTLRYYLYPAKIYISLKNKDYLKGYDYLLSDTILNTERRIIGRMAINSQIKYLYK